MMCRECFGNRFDATGRCVKCETVSFEAEDAIQQAAYEAKKRDGKREA